MVIHYSQINIILKRKYKYVAGYVTHCDDCVKPWLVIKYSNQIDLQKIIVYASYGLWKTWKY